MKFLGLGEMRVVAEGDVLVLYGMYCSHIRQRYLYSGRFPVWGSSQEHVVVGLWSLRVIRRGEVYA